MIHRKSARVMSSIAFIRHAQASLFDKNYDHLSELGGQQAEVLGRYLAHQRCRFDEIYIGPCRRHQQTADSVREFLGDGFPAPTQIAEFDEHQVDQLVGGHVEELAKQFPEVARLTRDFQAATEDSTRRKSFARLFGSIAQLWVGNRCPLFGLESWHDFHNRVNDGISGIVSRGGRGRRILVLTSAGTIAVAAQRALGCSDTHVLQLAWRLCNCSINSFLFSGDLFSLDQFNAMPHFSQRSEWTYM